MFGSSLERLLLDLLLPSLPPLLNRMNHQRSHNHRFQKKKKKKWSTYHHLQSLLKVNINLTSAASNGYSSSFSKITNLR